MPDLHRHENESMEEFIRRTFHEVDMEARKEWCSKHGGKCETCPEISCEYHREYGAAHNRVVN